MPDRLEAMLQAERDRLVVDQPPLSTITRRAKVLRRRRVAGQVAVVAVVAAMAGTAGFTVFDDRRAPETVTTEPTPSAVDEGGVWTALGITINGLPGAPMDLPGKVTDVEFVDGDRGYLLTADCKSTTSCTVSLAATTDGGRTWTLRPDALGGLSPAPASRLPRLVPFGAEVAVTADPGEPRAVRRSSADGGATWTGAEGTWTAPTTATLPGDARALVLAGTGPDGCGGRVGAWLPVRATGGLGLVEPPRQPEITACWVAPGRAGDGAWWVGGRRDGKPALAVSRDGGAGWTTVPLVGAGNTARVVTLGQDVHAVLLQVGAGGTTWLSGVAHSVDGGRTFGPVGKPGPAVAGDLVPLVDGRLLLVDGDGRWRVSTDHGDSWQPADGLHRTKRLARTSAGYVAYGMTDVYTAFSVDGTTWNKLNAT